MPCFRSKYFPKTNLKSCGVDASLTFKFSNIWRIEPRNNSTLCKLWRAFALELFCTWFCISKVYYPRRKSTLINKCYLLSTVLNSAVVVVVAFLLICIKLTFYFKLLETLEDLNLESRFGNVPVFDEISFFCSFFYLFQSSNIPLMLVIFVKSYSHKSKMLLL